MNTARSEQLRIALVISNGRYASMPALARCTASAAAARDALRGRGFEVMERSDLGRGEFDTSIGALARRLAAAPAASGALYYCGYAVEFNGRSFLLPASASIARDYDVLTQGIIAKSLVDSLIRGNESRGFVLLDVFRTPAASSTAALGSLTEQIRPSNFAVIGASNDGASEGPTAASLALRDQAAEGETSLDLFAGGIHRRLAKAAAVTAQFIPATGLARRPTRPRDPRHRRRRHLRLPRRPPSRSAAAASTAAGTGDPCSAGCAAVPRDHGGRGSDVRPGSAPGPGAARNHGILRRPDRRDIRP